jgi:hypothetical protein
MSSCRGRAKKKPYILKTKKFHLSDVDTSNILSRRSEGTTSICQGPHSIPLVVLRKTEPKQKKEDEIV